VNLHHGLRQETVKGGIRPVRERLDRIGVDSFLGNDALDVLLKLSVSSIIIPHPIRVLIRLTRRRRHRIHPRLHRPRRRVRRRRLRPRRRRLGSRRHRRHRARSLDRIRRRVPDHLGAHATSRPRRFPSRPRRPRLGPPHHHAPPRHRRHRRLTRRRRPARRRHRRPRRARERSRRVTPSPSHRFHTTRRTRVELVEV